MTQQPTPTHLVDAPLTKRFGAFLIDLIIRSMVAATLISLFVPDVANMITEQAMLMAPESSMSSSASSAADTASQSSVNPAPMPGQDVSGDVTPVMVLPLSVHLLFAALSAAVFFLVNGKLLAQHGQTIGKRLFNIRITHLRGSPVAIDTMVFRRYLPMFIADLIPLLTLVNVMPALYQRRCGHDYLAGTRVIDLNQSH